MGETDQVLSRFYGALVDEIRVQRPDYLTGQFTVAEIYQNLVPYGVHRDRIGVEINGDYEDALLRLLAGEGGYLILDSETALRDLREELESPNPNTGMYREYAAVDVRLNAARLDSHMDPSSDMGVADLSSHESEGVIDIGILTPSEDEAAGEALESESRSDLGREPTPESVSQSDGEPLAACRWCRAELPQGGTLNFCPFCGTDVNIVPCGECGEESQPEWRFCAACGAEAQG